jgi:hypothetical protein
MIDARHDENPSEMRCLVAIRIVRERLDWSLVTRGGQGWIASVFVESKAGSWAGTRVVSKVGSQGLAEGLVEG